MTEYPPPQNPNYVPQQEYPAALPPYTQKTQAPYPQSQAPYPQPQPYPAYPQASNPQQTVVVTQQQPVIWPTAFRDYPVTVTDSNGQQVQTILEYRAGALTWIICAIVCLFTTELGICCVALIPFCIDATKDIYHITPTDGKVVGVYKRI